MVGTLDYCASSDVRHVCLTNAIESTAETCIYYHPLSRAKIYFQDLVPKECREQWKQNL